MAQSQTLVVWKAPLHCACNKGKIEDKMEKIVVCTQKKLPICALQRWHYCIVNRMFFHKNMLMLLMEFILTTDKLDLLEVWWRSERLIRPLWWEDSRSAFPRRGDWFLGWDHWCSRLGWFVIWRGPVHWNGERSVEKRVVQRKGGQILVKWIWGLTKDYYYVPSTTLLQL